MRKSRVVGFAIAGILLVGTLAEAQSATTQPRPRRHATNRAGRVQDVSLRGITLSDAEKTRVKAIHAKYEPQFKALRDQGKTQFGSMRDARQKGDSSAAASNA